MNQNSNELMKYAYLLDQDNYCVENKIFIDLMWSIAKDKMISADKNGKMVMKAKSYIIRNSGIMFQQLFYWHFNAIKNGKGTKYQYKKHNVVKMDFEDWWNSIRLTDTEVSTANKFLIETGLIKIVKMRIKVRDKEIYKPSNCYIINIDILEKYLSNIVEISKEMYADKVEKIRIGNIKTSVAHSLKKKQSTELLTEGDVTLVTQETLNLNGLEGISNNISTVSTTLTSENNENDGSVTPITHVTGVTPVTHVTGVTPVTHVTGVTPVTHVTNKSNTSCANTSCANTSEENPSPSIPLTWEDLKEGLEAKMTNVSFNTWFGQSIANVTIDKKEINICTISEFSAEILKNRYIDILESTIKELTAIDYNICIKYVSEV